VIDLSNAKALRDFEFRDMDFELFDIDDSGRVIIEVTEPLLRTYSISQDELKELLRLSEWMTNDG
jgi:hypothetical protein